MLPTPTTVNSQPAWLRTTPVKVAWPLTVTLLLLGPPIDAQQAQDTPQFEERIEVTEVTLDVQVFDDQGNAILGLGPEDFEVTENGDPVEVLSATSYSSRYVAGDDKQPDSRFIVIVVHSPIGAEFDRPQMVRQRLQMSRDLSEWVESGGPGPSDWIAVVYYQSSLRVLQDFTQDREAVSRALTMAGKGKTPRSGPWRDDNGSPFALAAELPRDRQLIKDSATIYEALGILAEASGRIIGRKMLVLFSPGFGEFNGTVRLANADERYYDDLLAKLDDNNVAVYPVDLTPVEFEHPQKGMLQRIANDTGGDFAPFVNRFGNRMDDIADTNAAYYLIGYRVEHEPKDRGRRKVKVSTTNPNFKVVTRNGYFYEPEATQTR